MQNKFENFGKQGSADEKERYHCLDKLGKIKRARNLVYEEITRLQRIVPATQEPQLDELHRQMDELDKEEAFYKFKLSRFTN